MRKIFTLVAAALLSAGALSAAEPLFSETFETAEDFGRWLEVDANEDGSKWQFNPDGDPSHVYYQYNSKNAANDWLISPAINIAEAGSYMVSYEVYGSSYKEAIEVWYGSAQSVAAMTTMGKSHESIPAERQGGFFLVDAPAGNLHIGFHAVTPADRYRLYLCNMKVTQVNNPVDLRVTEIVTPVTGEALSQETVKVKIANDGLVDVDSYQVAFSVNDGEPVIETVNQPLAKGATTEYTFTAKANLSTPRGKYTVKAWTIHPDDIVPSNDAATANVRHVAPAAVPYFMGFEPDEDTSGFSYANLNYDDGYWHIAINDFFTHFSRTGDACMGYNYNKNNAGDDWFFLEPITMETGWYVLKFWYSATENHPERLRVCYGNAPAPEAMTNVLVEYDPATNEHYLESINVFELKQSGKIYFGFYCFSDADENWLVIDDLSIEKIDNTSLDLMITDVTAPGAYLREANKKDVEFTVRNVGIIDANATVNVYLDGTKVKSEPLAITKQEIRKITMTDALAGMTAGAHTYKVEIVCDEDNNTGNNVVEGTVNYLTDAVMLWDMEDAKLPAEFTYRVEDSATLHPDAGAEFNEDGFGIFNLEHYLLGNHALAAATWFTDDTSADRFIVMPKVKVTGKNAHFMWNSNSINERYREKYDVKVSTGDDKWYDYTGVAEISNESVYPQTRGIDLSPYEGKEIYVAFNIRTKGGEALILDNLGFYGDVEAATSGIEDVLANVSGSNAIKVVDGMIVVEGGAESIAVYDLSGRMMLSTNASQADITALPAGFYMAKAITPQGTATLKFAR